MNFLFHCTSLFSALFLFYNCFHNKGDNDLREESKYSDVSVLSKIVGITNFSN